MLRHDDRLSQEEAAAVARLHAERRAAKEAAEQAERERLAATTAPEDLASMIGATPEEVRALAEEIRQRPQIAEVPAVQAQTTKRPISPATLWLIIGAVVLFGLMALMVNAPSRSSGTPPTFIGGTGSTRQVRDPVWDPYAEAYTRDPFAHPIQRRVDVLLDSSIAAPPPGFILRLKTPVSVYVAAGPPASGTPLSPAQSQEGLRRAIRSMAQHVESMRQAQGNVPYLTFPSKVSWQPGRGNFSNSAFNNGAEFIGWHTFEIENSKGKTMAIPLPDKRYVRPTDTAAYEKEMDARLDWFLDGKSVPGAVSSMRQGAKIVRLNTPFPQGVTLCAMWPGGKLLAEGSGPEANAGAQVESALRELLVRAYKVGGKDVDPIRGIADYPGDSFEVWFSPHEYGIGSPSPKDNITAGTRLHWFREHVDSAYAVRKPSRATTTFTSTPPKVR